MPASVDLMEIMSPTHVTVESMALTWGGDKCGKLEEDEGEFLWGNFGETTQS